MSRKTAEANSSCIFCHPPEDRPVLTESKLAYTIPDKYPVSDGHSLIIPKIHIPDFFDLPEDYRRACFELLDRTKEILGEKHNPDGYNIGINIGRTAGQTIGHVHIHLIPRYEGDVENPTGGVRNVIPGRGDYVG